MFLTLIMINVRIILVIIIFLLGIMFFIELKNIIKDKIRKNIVREVKGKYNTLEEKNFIKWINNLSKLKLNLLEDNLILWLGQESTEKLARFILHNTFLKDKWLELIKKGNWWQKALYSKRLGKAKIEAAIPILLNNLKAEKEEVIYNSAAALLKYRKEKLFYQTAEKIIDYGWLTVGQAVDLLKEYPDPPLDMFLKRFENFNLKQKQIVLGLVNVFNQSSTAESLIKKALSDENKEVRLKAIKAASNFKSKNIRNILLTFLEVEAWEERALAAKVLGNFKGEKVINSLSKSLSDPNWWVRNNSAFALSNKGEQGILALTQILGTDDEFARDIAYHYLINDNNIFLSLRDKKITEDQKLKKYTNLIKSLQK